MTLRPLALAFFMLILGPSLDAQGVRPQRKKPFEELSRSAQRLKESTTYRLGFRTVPKDTALALEVDPIIAHDSLVLAARSQLGTRYILGAERPGQAFDCSGLVRFVMSALRIDLPRTAREQAQRGVQVEMDVAALRPGDLLTFGRAKRVSHIGVYIGEGRFIHASTSRRRVIEASIDKPGTWFRRNWVGVRRLLASNQAIDSTG